MDTVSFIFCTTVVAFYAWRRYGTPKTNRISTTKVQFYFTCGAYVLCGLALYGLIAYLVSFPEFLKFVGLGAKLPAEATGLPAPYLAALLLTTLLPNVPLLSRLDEGMLEFFRRLGAIPAEANRLAKQLFEMEYKFSDRNKQELEKFIRDSKDLPDDEMIDQLRYETQLSDPSARWRYTRNLSMYAQICKLRSERRYSNFFEDFADNAKNLDDRLRVFFAQARGFFAFSELVPAEEQKQSSVLKEARNTFKTQCNTVYDELCVFMAQALLHGSWSKAALKLQLDKLGFSQITPARPLILNTIATAAIYILLLVAGALVVASMVSSIGLPAGKMITLSLVIAVNHALAAVCALVPKRRWAFADRTRSGERPILAYLLSAGLAWLVASVVIFIHAGIWGDDYSTVGCWALSPAIAGFAIAFLCDDNINAKDEPDWQRWAEGAALGVLLSLVDYAIFNWTVSGGAQRISAVLPIGMGLGLGLLLGTLIPYSYRSACRFRLSQGVTPVRDEPLPPNPTPSPA